MSAKTGFQPRQDHKQELRRLVKNYNAKLDRIAKKNQDIVDALPDRASVRDLSKLIDTWNDFQKVAGRLRRFAKKGSETIVTNQHGERATRYAIDEFKRDQAAENRKKAARKKARQKREETKGGKPTGQTVAQMENKQNVRDIPDTSKFDDFKPGEFREKAKLFATRVLDSYDKVTAKRMQENYVKGLIREGYGERLQRLIARVPTDKFIEIVESDLFANFDFIYDEQERAAKEEQLLLTWEQHAETHNTTGINVRSIQKVVELEKLEKLFHP